MTGSTSDNISVSLKTSSLKDRLTILDFNWNSGRIILRLRKDGSPSKVGDYLDEEDPKDIFSYKEILTNDPLIYEITAKSDGWGMFGFHYEVVAYDENKIYYSWEYDGSSGYTCKFLNPSDLLNSIRII